MANDYNERRRRAGVRLTPEQEDWMVRAMDAQSKGLPLPPKPTETGEGGMQRLTPAYTDPRSQSIANSPIRPVRSMLDRIFSPGRADAVNQMNREYRENALSGQIGRQGQRIEQDYNKARTTSMMTSNKMEELKSRAMAGEPQAIKLLERYVQITGKAGGFDYRDLLSDGSRRDAAGGIATPNADGEDSATSPIDITRGDLTLTQNRIRMRQRLAEIDELIAQQQQIVDRKPQKVRRQASGRDWRPNMPEYVDIPFESSYSTDDIKAAPQKLEALQQEKEQLQTKISGPLTSPVTGGSVVPPDMGSPNRSTADQ